MFWGDVLLGSGSGLFTFTLVLTSEARENIIPTTRIVIRSVIRMRSNKHFASQRDKKLRFYFNLNYSIFKSLFTFLFILI